MIKRSTLSRVQGVFLCCIFLGLFNGIASAAAPPDQVGGLKIVTASPTPTYVTCREPCECMLATEAQQRWPDNYVMCIENPCGRTSNPTLKVQVNKYCYQVKSQPLIMTTTTPVLVPIQVQPPQQVVPAKIPIQPAGSGEVLIENVGTLDIIGQVMAVIRQTYGDINNSLRQAMGEMQNNKTNTSGLEINIPAQSQPNQGINSGIVLLIGGLVGLAIIGGLAYYGIMRRSGGQGDASDVRKDSIEEADFRPRKEVNQFVTRYAQDPEFRRQLKSNPADAIKNSGLDINDEDFSKLQAHSISELEKVFSNIPSVTRQGQSSAASASAVAAVYNFEGTSLTLGGFQPSDSLKQLMEKMVSDPSVRNLFQQDPMGAVKMISDLNLAPEELTSLRKLPIGQVIHGFSSIPNTTPTDIMDAANILSRTTHSIK